MFICTETECFLAKKLDVCFARKMDVYLHSHLMLVCKKVRSLLRSESGCFLAQRFDVCLQKGWTFACSETGCLLAQKSDVCLQKQLDVCFARKVDIK